MRIDIGRMANEYYFMQRYAATISTLFSTANPDDRAGSWWAFRSSSPGLRLTVRDAHARQVELYTAAEHVIGTAGYIGLLVPSIVSCLMCWHAIRTIVFFVLQLQHGRVVYTAQETRSLLARAGVHVVCDAVALTDDVIGHINLM